MSTSDDTVVVRRFAYRHDAEYAQALLREAGIESMLIVDDAGGSHVGLSFSNPARLFVRKGDADAAREILRSYLEEDTGSDSPSG